ncbi:tRNA(fMet)-specific endonuclease VapC [soil metagenome]
MKVMLDTDITSYIFTHRNEKVRRRFLAFSVGDVAISAITAGELVFGFQMAPSERIRRAVERALGALMVAPFDRAASNAYGEVRSTLQRRGTLIGPLDMLIAGHAISLDVPLATNNLREFTRVPGLRVENWLA